jgi:hypothetical protein
VSSPSDSHLACTSARKQTVSSFWPFSMQAGTPLFGSTGLSNIGKGAILLLDLPITVGCTGRSTHNTYRRSRPALDRRGRKMAPTEPPFKSAPVGELRLLTDAQEVASPRGFEPRSHP